MFDIWWRPPWALIPIFNQIIHCREESNIQVSRSIYYSDSGDFELRMCTEFQTIISNLEVIAWSCSPNVRLLQMNENSPLVLCRSSLAEATGERILSAHFNTSTAPQIPTLVMLVWSEFHTRITFYCGLCRCLLSMLFTTRMFTVCWPHIFCSTVLCKWYSGEFPLNSWIRYKRTAWSRWVRLQLCVFSI